MLLRDYLFWVRSLKDRTGRQQLLEDTKADLTTPFSKDRRQDFSVIHVSGEKLTAIMALIRGSMTGTSEEKNSAYLRWLSSTAKVLKVADGRDRDLTTASEGMLAWSRIGNKFGKHLVWTGIENNSNVLLMEVMEVLGSSGLPILNETGDVPASRKAVYEHARNQGPLGATVIPLANNPWYMQGYAISEIVNGPDTAANLQIVNIGTFQVLNLPWMDGPVTPSGQYELRVGINNRDEGLGALPQGTIRHPPPSLSNSHTGQPSGWACRVKNNPSYGSGTDPWETEFLIDLFSYDLDVGAPGDRLDPSTTASLWTSITSPPGNTNKSDLTQSNLVFNNWGCGYYDAASQSVWVLRSVSGGESKFRYRYDCAFTAKLKDTSTVSKNGRIFQIDRVAWTANGAKVLTNGVSAYDDQPSGLLSLVRVGQGSFPADTFTEYGGTLALSSPAATQSLRGLASASRFAKTRYWSEAGADTSEATPRDISDARYSFSRWGDARPGGDFWIHMVKTSPTNAITERRIARKDLSFTIATRPLFNKNVLLAEIGGRVWIFGQRGWGD